MYGAFFAHRRALFAALALFLALPLAAQGTGDADGEKPDGPYVIICPITGMIDEGMAVVVERAVEEARGADALIFDIDTPGGRVDSAIRITNAILEAETKTIAFVTGMGAISAGAIISYSCDEIIMAPATNMGASTPVMMGGQETSEAMNKKSMSFVQAKYRALADANGHSALLGEAMVDPAIGVGGLPLEDGTWQLFRLDSPEAPAEDDGDIRDAVGKVIDRIFDNIEERTPGPAGEVKDRLKEALNQQEQERAAEKLNAESNPEIDWTLAPDNYYIISREGDLLTLTAAEAEELGLASITANSIDEVLGYLELPKDIIRVRVEATWSEALFRWLTSPVISGLLLMLGVGGLYVEIRTPGFGIPGMVGATCLALFFGSYLVIGLADWVDLVLVVLGVALIIVELFYIPGFGLIGIAGVVSLLVGLYMSMVRVPIPEFTWEFTRVEDAGKALSIAIILFTAMVIATWRLLPRTPFYNALILAETQETSEGYIVQQDAEELSAFGKIGHATTMLRPAGRGRFDNKTYDVVTRGEFIPAKSPIEIIQVEGNRYVVAAVNAADDNAETKEA